MTKDTFILRTDWMPSIQKLSKEERGILMWNFFLLHTGREEEIELSTEKLEMLWTALLPQIFYNVKAYKDKCETNRANGKLGGRPPKDQQAAKEEAQNIINNPNNPNNRTVISETLYGDGDGNVNEHGGDGGDGAGAKKFFTDKDAFQPPTPHTPVFMGSHANSQQPNSPAASWKEILAAATVELSQHKTATVAQVMEMSWKTFAAVPGRPKTVTALAFAEWKRFVDVIKAHGYHQLFVREFLTPKDLLDLTQKFSFEESDWKRLPPILIDNGVDPEKRLFHTIGDTIRPARSIKKAYSGSSTSADYEGGLFTPVAQKKKTAVIETVQTELDYLYGMYCDGRCNIASISNEHYRFIERKNVFKFDAVYSLAHTKVTDSIPGITKTDDAYWPAIHKQFVLEFFEVMRSKGKTELVWKAG